MVAYTIQQKPALGRSAGAQGQEAMPLAMGSFLALLAFLRACVDATAQQRLSDSTLQQLLREPRPCCCLACARCTWSKQKPTRSCTHEAGA